MDALRFGSALLSLLLATHLILAPGARATSVTIPDDYPTIQQGIDSGADTVYVTSSSETEDLVATSRLVLLPTPTTAWCIGCLRVPVARSVTATDDLTVLGFRFTGPVVVGPLTPTSRNPLIHFESCRFDAGLTTGAVRNWCFLSALGCTFLGNAEVAPYSGFFANCAFIGAHLLIYFDGDAHVVSSAFAGSDDYAVRMGGTTAGTISNNMISGAVDGIVLDSPGVDVVGNVVTQCSGSGITATQPGGGHYYDNRVSNCGLHGIQVDTRTQSASPDFVGNIIENVGGDGIHNTGRSAYLIRGNKVRSTAGTAIFSVGVANEVTGNLVLDSGADGISIGHADRVDSNIVARAGSVGIRITGWQSHWQGALRRNTVYECAGPGIEMAGQADSILNNISSGNGGPGFVWSGTGTPLLACNDWFGNMASATKGVLPGPSDLMLDPLFCDLAQDDVHLNSASPLLDASGCGQIGALGEGCTGPASVAPGPSDVGLRFEIRPRPTQSTVHFAWSSGDAPVRIEVFDVTGARRWLGQLAAGETQLEWKLQDRSGRRLPPGVYLARLTRADLTASRKLVIAP